MPGSFPVAPKDVDTRYSLVGAMWAQLPGSSCPPPNQQAWAKALASGPITITSAPSPYHYTPLEVSPDLQLAVMGLPLNMSSLSLNVTLTSKPGSAAAALPLTVAATIADGYVFSDTVMTGGPQLQQMAPERSSTTATASLAVTTSPTGQPGAKQASTSSLNITIPDFKVQFVGKTAGSVGGRPWNGTLTFSLAGPVQLSGLLGCPRDCGPYGRCVAVSNATVATGSAAAAAGNVSYACECECGWAVDPASGKCELASGTCPIYRSSSGSRSLSLIDSSGNSSSGCSSDGSTPVMAQGGACPANYGFDVFSKTCSKCDAPDWSGPNCKLCTSDKACQAKLSKSNAICTTGLLWNERSREKSYACTLSDPGIARLIGPVLPINCKTAAAAAAGAKPGSSSAMAVDDASLMSSQSSCAIAMRLVGMPQGTFAECVATGCHFSAGRPSFVCDGVACSCPKGCPASYLKTFTDVSGAVTLTCDATGQDCSIVLGSLNMKIAASCEAAECIDPEGPKLVSTAELARSGPPIAPPLVAALPLLLLALGGLACGAALARYKPYLRGSSSSSKLDGKDMAGLAAAGNLSNGGGSTAAPSVLTACTGPGTGRIAMLAFAHVTADVKVPRTWRDIACVKSYKSWGDQGASAPAGFKADQAESKPYDLERGSNGSSKGEEDSPTPMSGSSSGGGGGGHNGTLIVPISTGPTAAAAAAGSSSSSGRWRPVLRGVSGSVASGQVLGVMGPSGGGKSTLLLKLCGSLGAGGRGSSWRSGGMVALDGVAAPAPLLAALTALVPQDDSLMRSLTAEECIRYSAALRLDPSLPPAAVAARVDDVMSRLGLSHVARSTVLSGTGVAGVSGGERRRVAIGMELVIDPQILVLDEPLSGLDSFTALQLMRTLQQVAASGRVVALSLHQPSPAIFASLDTAMLLAAGLMVYSGPPAAAAAALEGLGCPVPQGITVAEHMLHVVSDPNSLAVVVAAAQQRQAAQRAILGPGNAAAAGGRQRHVRSGSNDSASLDQQQQQQQMPWAVTNNGTGSVSNVNNNSNGGSGSPRLSTFKQQLKAAAGSTFSPRPSASGQARQALGIPNQKRPLGRQLGVLFWRGGLDMLRNPLLTAAHAAGGLLLGLLVGVIFCAVKNDTSGAQNRVGAIFFALCLLAFTSVTSVDLIQTESAAAGREMQRRYYHPAAYAATKLVLDGLLLRALPALLFALPFYFLMGLNPAALQFCTFLLVLIGFSAAVGALALGLAAGLNTPGKTLLAMNLVLLLGVLFGGFLANKGSIPVWLRWVSWLSVFRYSWEALVINELQGLDLFLSAPGVSLSLPVKGEVFLQIIGVQTGLFVVDIAVLAAIYAACCVFVLAVVGWRNRQRQH
uniref:ABC transporter domain-containing protein n=1 Tax=Tetradesmus obliquus TaxID=3088 RepID=A0A383V3X3_TETOB|eukprot:jgi/Sobl393_1/10457/SZX59620.1